MQYRRVAPHVVFFYSVVPCVAMQRMLQKQGRDITGSFGGKVGTELRSVMAGASIVEHPPS